MGLASSLNRTRKIGAEFEGFIIITGSGDARSAQESLAMALSHNSIPAIARPYSHDPLPPEVKVAIEYDGSIVPEQRYRGIRWAQIEAKIAPMTLDEWEQTVPPMLELLRYAGMRVNHSTGHHLHLSFNEVMDDPRTVRSLWNLYHRHQETIFHLVSPSRRQNSYCCPLPSETKFLHGANSKRALRRRLSSLTRRSWVNFTNLFETSPHIEIRSHQGTLDPAKARMWLHLHMAMFDHAVRRSCQAAPTPLPNSRKSFDALVTTIGMKPNTRVYAQVDPALRASAKALLQTWRKFNLPPRSQGKRRSSEDGSDAVREEVA